MNIDPEGISIHDHAKIIPVKLKIIRADVLERAAELLWGDWGHVGLTGWLCCDNELLRFETISVYIPGK